jgi:prevent-host-death family protein
MMVTSSDMKNGFGKYLRHVMAEAGEVIITKNNSRVARLVPYVSDIERYDRVMEQAPQYDYRHKTISYGEFMEIYEKTNVRMEFINGEIIMMSSPSMEHQQTLGDLYGLFRQYFKGKPCQPFLAPLDIHFYKKDIRDPDVMQPDLLVICDAAEKTNEKGRYMGIPALTLEILSPSTRSIDLVFKLNTFMMSGVREYWLVDPENRQITLYRFEDLQIAEYATVRVGETAKSWQFEGLRVALDELWETRD